MESVDRLVALAQVAGEPSGPRPHPQHPHRPPHQHRRIDDIPRDVADAIVRRVLRLSDA
jgi:hypothetical protein